MLTTCLLIILVPAWGNFVKLVLSHANLQNTTGDHCSPLAKINSGSKAIGKVKIG